MVAVCYIELKEQLTEMGVMLRKALNPRDKKHADKIYDERDDRKASKYSNPAIVKWRDRIKLINSMLTCKTRQLFNLSTRRKFS